MNDHKDGANRAPASAAPASAPACAPVSAPTGAQQDTIEAFFRQGQQALQAEATSDPAADAPRRCGLIAIVGRPNVGKSTLMNALVGEKVSITSRKAQTTRHRITGIRNRGATQCVFVDTPGFQTRHGSALNKSLNKTVTAALPDVDVVYFVVEAGQFGLADAKVLALLPTTIPVVLVANKLDQIKRRSDLLTWLTQMQERHPFAEIIPLSAKKPQDMERLLTLTEPYLPQQEWMYTQGELSDNSEGFLAREVIREKLFRLSGDELPYTSTVVLDQFTQEALVHPQPGQDRLCRIAATIVVEREGHKAMVIGEGGEKLKRIGTEARQDLERMLGAKVFLQLWVKVQSGWADDAARVRAYGYQ